MHGYPGLCSVVFEGADEVPVSDLTSDFHTYLENRLDPLGALVERVAGVTSKVLEPFYLAAEEENQYPRLVIVKPDNPPRLEPDVRTSPTPASSPMACAKKGAGDIAAAEPAEAMQRETWDRWMEALTKRKKFRMSFVCEYGLKEVRCGPDGNGYVVKDLPNLVKACLQLLQVNEDVATAVNFVRFSQPLRLGVAIQRVDESTRQAEAPTHPQQCVYLWLTGKLTSVTTAPPRLLLSSKLTQSATFGNS